MWYFNEAELLLLHYKLIEKFGGSHGILKLERVKSVVEAPKQSAFGQEQYPDIYQKAAVYIRNVIGDHPFNDGNKRTGISAGVFFLQKNGKKVGLKKGELEDFAVRVAVDHLDIETIAIWLKDHTN